MSIDFRPFELEQVKHKWRERKRGKEKENKKTNKKNHGKVCVLRVQENKILKHQKKKILEKKNSVKIMFQTLPEREE